MAEDLIICVLQIALRGICMTLIQTKLLELLLVFAKLCDKYGLKYYLAGGTLLGAVRHHGFIPWDDDIDVMMPFEDYLKFLKLAEKLPEGMVIQSAENDPFYPFLFAKMCDTESPIKTQNEHGPWGTYIDIFPLLPSRCPTKLAIFYFNIISIINYVLQVKCGWTSYIPYKKVSARLGYRLLNTMNMAKLRKLRSNLVKMLSKDDSGYVFSFGGVHKGAIEFFPCKWFESTILLSFAGERFPCISGWDEYLRQLYGDYMVLPPKTDRIAKHIGERIGV